MEHSRPSNDCAGLEKGKVLSLSQVMLLLNNNNTNTNNRNISIIVVIVIGGVFGADHQRVPIASNGPAAIRPLLSHLLLRKHDLNRFFCQFLFAGCFKNLFSAFYFSLGQAANFFIRRDSFQVHGAEEITLQDLLRSDEGNEKENIFVHIYL